MFYLRRSHCQALGLTVVFFSSSFTAFYFFFAFPFMFLILLIHYVLLKVFLFSLFFMFLLLLLSLTSLTFACLSVVSRSALSEAREMEESLRDTWTHFVSL